MPAIQLLRLRQQVADLVSSYAETDIFLRKLRDLFDYYGDRIRRPGQFSKKTTALPTANVPLPVLRQIVADLTPYAEIAPHVIIGLAQTLWTQVSLEHHLLAAQLLGKVPVDNAEEVLFLVSIWCLENREEAVLEMFATRSLAVLQKQNPGMLLEQVGWWLEIPTKAEGQTSRVASMQTDKLRLQKLGVSALVPLAQDPQFENLPKVFRLIEPLLAESPKPLRPYLLDLLRPLARRSPQEVAFILRRCLTECRNPGIEWLARRTLPALPPDIQENLRPIVIKPKGSPPTM